MKAYDLQPTFENLYDTLLNDAIGRNTDILCFTEILNNITGSYSIALDGRWGSGKTFFVKQAKLLIDANNAHIKTLSDEQKESINNIFGKQEYSYLPQVCVYYDAWENDNDEDPILSLIYSIVESTNGDFSFAQDASIFKIAASVLSLFTEKNWNDVLDALRGTNPFDVIKSTKEIENTIKDFLDSLLEERGERLIIFIDELDRCKPTYAVKLLERIKHYFSNERITFVFSVNISELHHTIKKHYGDNFDACRYLDRFFDLRTAIPEANKQKFYRLIGFDNESELYDLVCSRVIDNLNMSLREISKYVSLTKLASQEFKKLDFSFVDGRAKRFCLTNILPIMIGLKITDQIAYDKFVNGKYYQPLVDILSNFHYLDYVYLLNDDETFDTKQPEKKLVTKQEKLIAVYEAVFNTRYTYDMKYIQIGNYTFTQTNKEFLIKVANLISRNISFSDIKGEC